MHALGPFQRLQWQIWGWWIRRLHQLRLVVYPSFSHLFTNKWLKMLGKSKKSSPEWWFLGDLPWYKSKNIFGIILTTTTNMCNMRQRDTLTLTENHLKQMQVTGGFFDTSKRETSPARFLNHQQYCITGRSRFSFFSFSSCCCLSRWEKYTNSLYRWFEHYFWWKKSQGQPPGMVLKPCK